MLLTILQCMRQLPEKAIRSPGTRATNGCNCHVGAGNSGPLEVQPVPLTSGSSLQPTTLLFFNSPISAFHPAVEVKQNLYKAFSTLCVRPLVSPPLHTHTLSPPSLSPLSPSPSPHTLFLSPSLSPLSHSLSPLFSHALLHALWLTPLQPVLAFS